MKFKDLPIKNIRDVEEADAYMICNVIEHDSEDVNNINKSLIHISNFAHKEALNAIVEQNKKLVGVVTNLISKCNAIDGELNDIKQSLTTMKPSNYEGIDKLNEQIEDLKERLDKNLIEI